MKTPWTVRSAACWAPKPALHHQDVTYTHSSIDDSNSGSAGAGRPVLGVDRLAEFDRRSAVEPNAGNPHRVNSTVKTSPVFPDGKSPGARYTAPREESGKVLA